MLRLTHITAKLLCLLLAVACSPNGGRSLQSSSWEPPPSVRDLDSFLEWQSEKCAFFVVNIDGKKFFFAEAGLASPRASGPVVYVFNEHLELVEWTIDSGEAQFFEDYETQENLQPISLSVILQASPSQY